MLIPNSQYHVFNGSYRTTHKAASSGVYWLLLTLEVVTVLC